MTIHPELIALQIDTAGRAGSRAMVVFGNGSSLCKTGNTPGCSVLWNNVCNFTSFGARAWINRPGGPQRHFISQDIFTRQAAGHLPAAFCVSVVRTMRPEAFASAWSTHHCGRPIGHAPRSE